MTANDQTNGATNGHANGHANGEQKEEIVLTKVSEFPLSTNGLEDLATFIDTDAGLALVSKVDLPAGSHFAYLTSHVPQEKPIWRTIQTSKNTHTDPRSALLYMNHSCAPSVEVHVFSPNENGKYPSAPPDGSSPKSDYSKLITEHGLAGEVKIARNRDIKKGDHLTFFYPSTEWAMDRPFDCLCGAPKDVCLGSVQGSKYIPNEKIDTWFVNDHIKSLKKAQQ
jgi:hypothetical protein